MQLFMVSFGNKIAGSGEGGFSMKTQIVQFPVQIKNGVISKIGKSIIMEPKIYFNGKGIRWYEDKPKSNSRHSGLKKSIKL